MRTYVSGRAGSGLTSAQGQASTACDVCERCVCGVCAVSRIMHIIGDRVSRVAGTYNTRDKALSYFYTDLRIYGSTNVRIYGSTDLRMRVHQMSWSEFDRCSTAQTRFRHTR